MYQRLAMFCLLPADPENGPTAFCRTKSAMRKNALATTTITNTIAVVIIVSLRDGQVTFSPSART